MIIELYRLGGGTVMDKASGVKGMLTHCQLGKDTVYYSFQPKGLNPETGEPVKSRWITRDRISGGERYSGSLPMEVLGTVVMDRASGFKGVAIFLTLHISGCVHFLVQPKGTVKKTGALIEDQDFDMLRLSGSKIATLSPYQKAKVKKDTPSPAPVSAYVPKA